MSELDLYRQRAREAEVEASLVTLPANRRRYLEIARCWRELADAMQPQAELQRTAA